MKDIKIVLMGTPLFAATIFESLILNGYNISLIVSQMDKEVGRKKILTPPSCKEVAIKYSIPWFQPYKISQDYEIIKKINPDLIITCAYGQFLPRGLLAIPRLGCINIHASILPKLRGGAPIHHAIIDGYNKSGVTIMEMIDKMDAGAILAVSETNIEESDTYDLLHDRLMYLGKDLILDFLPKYLKGDYQKVNQNEAEVTFGYNIKREEEKIEWNRPVKQVFNHIRGLNSTPGAYTTLENQIVKIYEVRYEVRGNDFEPGKITINNQQIEVDCLDGKIIVDSLQFSGKNKVSSLDFLKGNSRLLLNKRFL